jgi:hypothetical protein
MKSWKVKVLVPLILLSVGFLTYLILYQYSFSSGKRVGNLVKISKKGKIIKTWEGTMDEGSGDKLTSYFSVRNEDLGEQLYEFEGKQVVIYYEEYLVGWPWETKYNVTSWKPQDVMKVNDVGDSPDNLIDYVGKTLFCSILGTLLTDQDLYSKVKEHVKKNNIYLYDQFAKCNE